MKPLLVACCASVVACAAFLTVRAGAQPAIMTSPQFVTFGMVGLNAGQTARLNALALPTGGPLIAGASCQVTFDFYDASGKSVKTGTATVAQGAAVYYDLQRTDIDHLTDRREIRGALRAAFVTSSAVGTPGTPISAFCSILPTLEIFDSSSGQTTVVLQQTSALPLVMPL